MWLAIANQSSLNYELHFLRGEDYNILGLPNEVDPVPPVHNIITASIPNAYITILLIYKIKKIKNY